MRCEAGAYFDEHARIRYLCKREALVELVSGAAVVLVYCKAHAEELAPAFLKTWPGTALRLVTVGSES